MRFVDGALALEVSGSFAGVHAVPVDGPLEETGTPWIFNETCIG